MDLERNGLQSGHNHGPSSNSAASSTTNGYYHHNHLTPSRPTTRTGITKCMCQALYLLRFFPFAMITILFVWGFYVYSYFIIYRGYEDQLALRILLVIFFLPLYILSYWSYIRTVFGTNRPIPDLYALPDSLNLNTVSDDEINQTLEQTILDRNLPVYTRSYNGYVRYCRKCNVIKPDRCHHCSTCGACIRKMDHHCHWVSNCVAYDNYKYFLLFLAYTVMLALYTAGSSAKQFIKFWKDEEYSGRFQVFFLVVFCSVFSLSILFLLSYHIYLVLKNMSTLEAYQPPRFKNAEQDHFRFNLGAGRNFRSVFGDNKLLWFLPVPSSNFGDGLQFDLRLNPTPAQFDKSSQSALFTNNSSENAAIIGQQQHSLQYNQQEV